MNRTLELAVKEKRNLTEAEAYQLLAEYDIPVPDYLVVTSENQAWEAADRLNYPLIMKILSPDIIHKTDIGGVVKDICSPEDALKAYQKIIKQVTAHKPEARIEGILVAEQLSGGIEIIVGMTRDPQFGPTIMFGLGGIFAEVLRDVSFRVCPLNHRDAEEMLEEIKGIKLLRGYRNQPGCDLEAVKKIIRQLSLLTVENPVINEIDLNPVIVDHAGATAVDGKVLIK